MKRIYAVLLIAAFVAFVIFVIMNLDPAIENDRQAKARHDQAKEYFECYTAPGCALNYQEYRYLKRYYQKGY